MGDLIDGKKVVEAYEVRVADDVEIEDTLYVDNILEHTAGAGVKVENLPINDEKLRGKITVPDVEDVVVLKDYSQTLTNKSLSVGCTVLGADDLPNTCSNLLTDHNKATHDALNIDADTVDGIDLPNTCAAVLTDHNRTTHDALGSGEIVFTEESQTLKDKTLSNGCTVLGADDLPNTCANLLTDHNRTTHDALGTGSMVFTEESQTLKNKTLSTGCTVLGADDLPNTCANLLTDHNRSTHDALGTGLMVFTDESQTLKNKTLSSGCTVLGADDLPNTCANLLTDHNRTTHDALGTGSIVFTDETQTLTNKTISTGCTITLDNNTYLKWKDSAGTTQNVIGLGVDDFLRISAPDSKPIIIGVNRVNPIQIDNQGIADATTTTYDSNQLHIAGNYWNGTAGVDRKFTIQHHMIDATPTSELVFKLDGTDLLKLKDSGDLVPASDNSSVLGSSSKRWSGGYFSGGVWVGTPSTGAHRGAHIRGTEGALELWRGDDGVPYIDFKTDYATDFDARIQKSSDHGLDFRVGGSGSILKALQLTPTGATYAYYYLVVNQDRDYNDALYLRRNTSVVGKSVFTYFSMKDAGGNWRNYASVGGYIEDNASGSQDGELFFGTYNNGTHYVRWKILSDGTFRPGADNSYSIGNSSYRVANVYTYNVQLPDGGLLYNGGQYQLKLYNESTDLTSHISRWTNRLEIQSPDAVTISIGGVGDDKYKFEETTFKPSTDNTYDLGTSSYRWKNAHVVNAYPDKIRLKTDGTAAEPCLTWDGDPNTGIFRSAENNIHFTTGAVARFGISDSAIVSYVTNRPNADNSVDLGTSSQRWKNVYCVNLYSGDINLENGWKITEHPEHGVVLKSPSGKTYKFKLEEVK